MEQNKTLNVYKASAGSGKTYTLTEQYIKLLINTEYSDEEQFRHILAVTFTNKATDEMKSRIIERLYEISQKSEPQKIADTTLSPERAKEILKAILHNYSFFRITTIDKFFQQIIRAFVRELGLNGNYAIELDEKELIDNTISDIILRLGDAEYAPFMKWFSTRLIGDNNNSDENEKFDKLKNELITLCSLITKDTYAQIKNQLPNEETISEATTDLKKICKAAETEIYTSAKKALEVLDKCIDIDTELSKGAVTQLKDTVNGTEKFPKELKPTTLKWKTGIPCNKKMQATMQEKIPNDAIIAIQHYIEYIENNLTRYFSAKFTVKSLPYLQLFKSIEEEINRRAKESNIQLLSKSGDLIKEIIAGSDAPFIYEKVGSFIEHYFIDEFQDTSHLQWDNFKPLITDSLASNNSNLIVGDIKQSIYRFRNSDWKILGEEIGKDFINYFNEQNLSYNRRSLGNIIDFNNQFFTRICKFLQESYNKQSGRTNDMITKAYADVVQQIPNESKKGKGYVEINFIAKDKKTDDETQDTYSYLLNDINRLRENGYRLSDIGILVRWNPEAQSIAQYLLSNGINVISEEALKISSNEAVSDIVAILNHIVNPKDSAHKYLVNEIICKEKKLDIQHLSTLPLYELIEEVIFELEYDRTQSNIPYLSAFKDLATNHIAKKGANIKNFLEWWNENCLSKSLTTASTGDAINILTIHKSKGLAYKALLIPLLNWDFKKVTREIMWTCITDNMIQDIKDNKELDIYKKLNHVIVDYSSAMANTIFKEPYYDELLMNYIDNLNFLYVAFTRAREVLIAYAQVSKKKYENPFSDIDQKPFSSMFEMLASAFEKELDLEGTEPFEISIESTEQMCRTFHLGEIPKQTNNGDDINTSKSLATSKSNNDALKSEMSPEEKLKQFPLRGEEFKEFNRDYSSRDYGTRMHSIMERIRTVEDIEPILEELQFKGYIDNTQRCEINENLMKYVNNPEAAEWFSPKYRVVTERTIVKVTEGPNGLIKKELRPDRVIINPETKAVTIIDYKFGEKTEESKHKKQVAEYMNLYKETGHKDVTGFIYYFEGLKIIKVV